MSGPKQAFANNSLFAFFKKPQPVKQIITQPNLRDTQAFYQKAYKMVVGKPLHHPCYKTAADLLAQISDNHLIPGHLTCYEDLPKLSIKQVQRLFECNPKAALALVPDVRIPYNVNSISTFFDLLHTSEGNFVAFIVHYHDIFKQFVTLSDHVATLVSLAPNYAEQLLFKLQLTELLGSLRDIYVIMKSAPQVIPRLLDIAKIAQMFQSNQSFQSSQAQQTASAILSYLKHIANDNADAAFALGHIYQHGLCLQTKDEDQYMYYYSLAANAGHVEAANIIGGNYIECAKYFIAELRPDIALILLQKIPYSHPDFAEALFLKGQILATSIPEKERVNAKSELGAAIVCLNQSAALGCPDAAPLRNGLLLSYYDIDVTSHYSSPAKMNSPSEPFDNIYNTIYQELLDRFTNQQLLNETARLANISDYTL